jgi:hypothetical protein
LGGVATCQVAIGFAAFFGVAANVGLLQHRESLQNIGFATTSIVAINGFSQA